MEANQRLLWFVTVGVTFLYISHLYGASVNGKTVQSEPLNGKDEAEYRHCGQLKAAGYNTSGQYILRAANSSDDILVHCQFEDGTSTTVMLYRAKEGTTFARSYASYHVGFGSMEEGTFWIGLGALHFLTRDEPAYMRILLTDHQGNTKYVDYTDFYVGDIESGYRLDVSGYQGGDIGDMMHFSNAGKFYAYDKQGSDGCAGATKAGWWYNRRGHTCTYTLPTGKRYSEGYYDKRGSQWDGAFWLGWLGFDYSYESITMTLTWFD